MPCSADTRVHSRVDLVRHSPAPLRRPNPRGRTSCTTTVTASGQPPAAFAEASVSVRVRVIGTRCGGI